MTHPILFPNTLIHSGLLFQQFVLDIELQAMAKDLQYFRKPEMQKMFRKDCLMV
jgi:hypothetical protein